MQNLIMRSPRLITFLMLKNIDQKIMLFRILKQEVVHLNALSAQQEILILLIN